MNSTYLWDCLESIWVLCVCYLQSGFIKWFPPATHTECIICTVRKRNKLYLPLGQEPGSKQRSLSTELLSALLPVFLYVPNASCIAAFLLWSAKHLSLYPVWLTVDSKYKPLLTLFYCLQCSVTPLQYFLSSWTSQIPAFLQPVLWGVETKHLSLFPCLLGCQCSPLSTVQLCHLLLLALPCKKFNCI